ncbi:bifunctional DedA family/phosphatase PAP2 family protein [Halomonas denitrificans]|uniref:bifunctional DedA family/phosphatase PAP2 family protein n=1 Tax=Halomonas denitrificans TaxID=370769 RepID=UPI001C99928E|nr:bifunctional DedA family/phosphatase PAP2 family protein [Halomonas denitrificans]MBY5969025.1 bifunctional DedA family/phosphatase PAP2 family protein [Halomonas denitrificans]
MGNAGDWLIQWAPSPGLLLLSVFAIALVESLALVGVVVPGVVLITAAASLAGHQEIAVGWVMACAFAGAIVGDGVSYTIGYRYREQVTTMWPLSHHPEWLSRGARFFQRHGPLSVLLGRFVGPVRPIVPLVAGILHMPPATFTWANVGSAALWAPAYILPGYLLGRTWQQWLALPQDLHPWLTALGITVVALAIIFSLVRHHASPPGFLFRSLSWLTLRLPGGQRLWRWLAPTHEDEPPLATWLLLLGSLTTLCAWTLVVLQADGPLPMDERLNALVSSLDIPHLATLSTSLAKAGDTLGVIVLALPWLGWLLWRRRWAALSHIAAGLAGIGLLNTLGKSVIGRLRPDAPDYLADSLSYPSAHTSTAVVLYGLAAAFIAQRLPHHRRFWPYWVAIAIIVPMALSRIVLGVHWLSDLIGGALLGLVVCAMVQLSWLRRERPGFAGCPGTYLGLASLVLINARMLWLPPV